MNNSGGGVAVALEFDYHGYRVRVAPERDGDRWTLEVGASNSGPYLLTTAESFGAAMDAAVNMVRDAVLQAKRNAVADAQRDLDRWTRHFAAGNTFPWAPRPNGAADEAPDG